MIRDRLGDHGGRFELPDGRRAHGTLSLEADRAAVVSLHPDDRIPIGSGGRGFPVDSTAEHLVGHLYSNEEVILGDVHLSEWFPEQFRASSRWALLGLSITRVPDYRWNTARIAVTGLECLLGNAIARTFWPSDGGAEPQRYSAELNSDAEYVSTYDDVEVTAGYSFTFSPANPYTFNISNYATLTLLASHPLTVDEWLDEWIRPLLGLLTLATGEEERINWVAFSVPDPTQTDEVRERSIDISARLFGGGIFQRDPPAERRTLRNGAALVPLFTLDASPPLAELVRTWHTRLADETATSLFGLAIDPTLPPSVRYLLCSQALEGLDASLRSTNERTSEDSYRAKRAVAVSVMNEVDDELINSTTKNFIRKYLSRLPPRSLSSRFRRLIRALPAHEERSATWTTQTERLGAELESLDRAGKPLHERLASARNALSHGESLSPAAVLPANRVLLSLLRAQLILQLGFSESQVEVACDRMAREQLR